MFAGPTRAGGSSSLLALSSEGLSVGRFLRTAGYPSLSSLTRESSDGSPSSADAVFLMNLSILATCVDTCEVDIWKFSPIILFPFAYVIAA